MKNTITATRRVWLYALTPWEPYRGLAAMIAGLFSTIMGYGALLVYGIESGTK